MDLEIKKQRILGNFFSGACNAMFQDPLYNHMTEGRLEVLLWSDDHSALMEWLVAAVSCGCMGVEFYIRVCGRGIDEFHERILKECPMFDSIFSRQDTATITFSEFPDRLPAYIACSEAYAAKLPEGQFHVLMRKEDVSDELMMLAENLHYSYTVSYGSRESLSMILKRMKEDSYSTNSSVIQAAHIPVKLHIAGIHEDTYEQAAAAYTELIERDKAMINSLVYLEHTRWTAFLCLCGWRIPTEEEMSSYAFVIQENLDDFIAEFRHKKALLHPSLAACSPQGDILAEPESAKYWDGTADDSGLDDLSRISLWQHRYVSALAEEHRKEALALIEQFKAGFTATKPELNRLEDAIRRLHLQKTGSGFEVQKALDLAKPTLGNALYEKIIMRLQSTVEASRRRSYLQGDVFATNTIGFVLLYRRRFTRIIRTLSDSAEANVTGLMRLDPEKVVFITGFDSSRSEAVERELRGGVETFVQIRNLRTEVCFIDCNDCFGDMDAAIERALLEAGSDAIFDVSSAPADFCFTVVEKNRDAFMVKGGMLKPLRGLKDISAMNTLPRDLLVEDFFAAMDQKAFADWEVPDIAGIQRIIEPTFRAYLELTENANAIAYSGEKGLLAQINNLFRWKTYQKESSSEKEHRWMLSAETAINRNVRGCLVRLQSDGFISDLKVDPIDDLYCYTFKSPQWVDPGKKNQPLLDILMNSHTEGYICAVKYEAKKGSVTRNPRLKITYDTFSAPTGTDEALRLFEKAGCFKQVADGRWSFTSTAAKAIFAKEGNILEDYVFSMLMRNPNYKSVALSYSFGRVDQISDQEIDVIAITRDNRPVMFSCKLGETALDFSAIKEIGNHCRIYSFNKPIPVLVTACTKEVLENKGFVEGGKGFAALKAHGVHFVDRTILADENRFHSFLNEISRA